MAQYKKYPNSNLIRDWDKLIELTKEEVEKIYEEWKEVEKENKKISEENYNDKNTKLNEIAKYLISQGIDVYKYKRNSIIPEKTGYQAWFQKNIADPISNKYPSFPPGFPYAHMDKKTINGIDVSNNQSPTNLVELHNRIKSQYNSRKKESEKVNKLLIKSIEYAAKNNINIDGVPSEKIVEYVDEMAKQKYLEENLPPGTEVYLKHACDECSTYIMGDRRCSCGNRRISIEVEGDIIEGFYYYPEPY